MQKQTKLHFIICIALLFFYVIEGPHVQSLLAYNKQTEIGQLADGRKMYRTEGAGEKQRTPFGYGSSSSKITWQEIYATPMITIEGIGYVYCIEPNKNAPNGNIYNQGKPVSNPGVMALLQAGFPYDKGNLTNHEAYIRTFVALNGYLGTFNRGNIEKYGDAYVNRLLKQADQATAQNAVLAVAEPASVATVYNEKTQRLETDSYQVKGPQGNFWLEQLPTTVYPVNEKGERAAILPIGSKFRIATEDMTLDHKVDFKINTDVKTREVIRYQATGVQDVIALQARKAIAPIASRVVIQPRVAKINKKKEKPQQELVKNKQEPALSKNVWRKPTLVKTGQSNWHRAIAVQLCFWGILFFICKTLHLRRMLGAQLIAAVIGFAKSIK